jgi:hypothetical protein
MLQNKMFDNYIHSYQMNAVQNSFSIFKMNAVQNSFSIFKMKKMKVYVDEEWVLCDLNNNNNTNAPEPILRITPVTIADKKIISQATPVNIFGLFYFLYEGIFDIVEEILTVPFFTLFD